MSNKSTKLDENVYKFLQLLGCSENNGYSFCDGESFYIPMLGETKIRSYIRIDDILTKIYNNGYKLGLVQGRKEKQNEICIALGLRDNY